MIFSIKYQKKAMRTVLKLRRFFSKRFLTNLRFARVLAAGFVLGWASLSHGACDAGLVFNLSGASSKTVDALCSQLLLSPSSSVSLFIPWNMLEDMRREGVNKKLTGLFASGQAELFAGIFYGIDLFRAKDAVLHSQIKRFKMLAESISGSAADGFYPQNLKLSRRALRSLKNMGFKYALSDESCVPEEIEAQRLQAFLMPDSLLLYPVSGKISKAVSLPPARGWLEEFVKTAGAVCGDVAGSIPGGSVVFNVRMSGYTAEDIAELFSALRKMNIKVRSVKKLSLKEPSYFKELSAITEAVPGKLGKFQQLFLAEWKKLPGKLGKFQQLFLAEWKKFYSMSSSFPSELSENIYKMGNSKYFASPVAKDTIGEMLALTRGFYDCSGSFDLSLDGENILAVSNGYLEYIFQRKILILF